jgi:hypothetical protein
MGASRWARLDRVGSVVVRLLLWQAPIALVAAGLLARDGAT